jgi:hypothetical protein
MRPEVPLPLASGEHLTSVKPARGQRDGRRRIFSAACHDGRGAHAVGGSPTFDTVTYTTPSSRQIAGFTGRSGDEIDKFGAIDAPK